MNIGVCRQRHNDASNIESINGVIRNESTLNKVTD